MSSSCVRCYYHTATYLLRLLGLYMSFVGSFAKRHFFLSKVRRILAWGQLWRVMVLADRNYRRWGTYDSIYKQSASKFSLFSLSIFLIPRLSWARCVPWFIKFHKINKVFTNSNTTYYGYYLLASDFFRSTTINEKFPKHNILPDFFLG